MIFPEYIRLLMIAELSAPLSHVVMLLLTVTNVEDGAVLSCMTIVVFGVMSLLIAANMIIESMCDYKGTVESTAFEEGSKYT